MLFPPELLRSLSLLSWRSVLKFGDSLRSKIHRKCHLAAAVGFFCCAERLRGEFLCWLGQAALGLPLLCAASSVGTGFWALTMLLGETFLSHRPFQFPHHLFLDPVIGIPLLQELALEPDSFPRASKERRVERLKSWGTAADVLPQNGSHQCLVSWPVPKSSGLGSTTLSSPSGCFGCWKGLFVPHRAAMYLAGTSW